LKYSTLAKTGGGFLLTKKKSNSEQIYNKQARVFSVVKGDTFAGIKLTVNGIVPCLPIIAGQSVLRSFNRIQRKEI